jgi:hypothetical protein
VRACAVKNSCLIIILSLFGSFFDEGKTFLYMLVSHSIVDMILVQGGAVDDVPW